jgi:hypothetical protein
MRGYPGPSRFNNEISYATFEIPPQETSLAYLKLIGNETAKIKANLDFFWVAYLNGYTNYIFTPSYQAKEVAKLFNRTRFMSSNVRGPPMSVNF